MSDYVKLQKLDNQGNPVVDTDGNPVTKMFLSIMAERIMNMKDAKWILVKDQTPVVEVEEVTEEKPKRGRKKKEESSEDNVEENND